VRWHFNILREHVIAVAALVWNIAYCSSAHRTGDQMRSMAGIIIRKFAYCSFREPTVRRVSCTPRRYYPSSTSTFQHLSRRWEWVCFIELGLFYVSDTTWECVGLCVLLCCVCLLLLVFEVFRYGRREILLCFWCFGVLFVWVLASRPPFSKILIN